MFFTCEKILTEDELLLLKETANRVSWDKVYQYFHIFGVDISRRSDELSGLDQIIEKFRKHLKLGSNVRDVRYFLDYGPGSFARSHKDHETIYTVITLIEANNLVGGDTVVFNPYVRPPEGRSANLICKRDPSELDNPPYNQDIIPTVIRSEVGESMIYGPDLRHSVSQVIEGNRKVFVTWFMKE